MTPFLDQIPDIEAAGFEVHIDQQADEVRVVGDGHVVLTMPYSACVAERRREAEVAAALQVAARHPDEMMATMQQAAQSMGGRGVGSSAKETLPTRLPHLLSAPDTDSPGNRGSE